MIYCEEKKTTILLCYIIHMVPNKTCEMSVCMYVLQFWP